MIRRIWTILLLLLGNSLLLLSQNYKIGDVIVNPDGSKGVVFYVNDNRTGGWMVAIEDASSGCAWGKRTTIQNLPLTGSSDQFRFDLLLPELNGYNNTGIIRAKAQSPNSGWPSPYAAGVVDYAHGWYLPSIGQLRILYANLALLEANVDPDAGFTSLLNANNKFYWSSTQKNQDYAYAVKAVDGTISSSAYKTTSSNYAVRAIRDFTMTGGFATYQWNPTNEVTPDIYVSPTETTEYTVTAFMGTSCYATDSQTITVVHVEDTVFSETACESYEWKGTTYTTSGTYTKPNTTPEGCNYTLTLNLTILPPMSVTVTADDPEICEGDSTTLHAVVPQPDFYAPGDILCTDGTIVKAANWPVSGKTAKGIVFYVDRSGKHGWVVDKDITRCQAPNFYNEPTVKWSSNNYATRDIPGLTNYDSWKDAIKDFDGYSNTQIVREYTAVTTGSIETYPAAGSVDFEHGWYIPAAGQLNILFGEILVVNTSLSLSGIGGSQISPDGEMWSSTEFATSDYTNVRVLKLQLSGDYGTGRIMHDDKKQKRTLRAVKTF